MCDAWLSLDYTVSNASVANLLLISFDRYMCVTRPLKYRVRRTPRCAIAMIVVAWVVSTLLWTPWIVAWPFIDVSSIIIIIIITFTHVDYVGRRGEDVRDRLFVYLSVCLSVCMYVRNIIEKRMIPKCSNLAWGTILSYTRSGMVLGLKGQGHRVNNTTQ